ncbi:hypothetical protein [Tahibacter harae]|uniref:Uncharacterized protein n=1 Tax=Tahibacter harae TaxID=2963937 RepID=A0ABT1QKR2_9GAMM|nr:hypothetical protein [Tahibacter harae]MCQ4163120.1 hypothetical protein [Tahibacter harae]
MKRIGQSLDSVVFRLATFDHRLSGANREAVEPATLEWVDWFNRTWLPGSIAHIPPAN